MRINVDSCNKGAGYIQDKRVSAHSMDVAVMPGCGLLQQLQEQPPARRCKETGLPIPAALNVVPGMSRQDKPWLSPPSAIPGSQRPDAAMVIFGEGRISRKWLSLYQEKMCSDTVIYRIEWVDWFSMSGVTSTIPLPVTRKPRCRSSSWFSPIAMLSGISHPRSIIARRMRVLRPMFTSGMTTACSTLA